MWQRPSLRATSNISYPRLLVGYLGIKYVKIIKNFAGTLHGKVVGILLVEGLVTVSLLIVH